MKVSKNNEYERKKREREQPKDWVALFENNGTLPEIVKLLKNSKLSHSDIVTLNKNKINIYDCIAPIIHQPSLQLTKLSGVISFSYWPDIAGRKILLLGEQHNTMLLCNKKLDFTKGEYEVHAWLASIAEITRYYKSVNPEIVGNDATGKCLDIFIETPYRVKRDKRERFKGVKSTVNPLKQYNAPLDAINESVTRSIRSDVRLHYVDTRTMVDEKEAIYNDFISDDGFHYIEPLSHYNVIKAFSQNPDIINKIVAEYDLYHLLSYIASRKTGKDYFNYYKGFVERVMTAYGLDYKINEKEEAKFHNIMTKRFLKMDPSIDAQKLFTTLIASSAHESVFHGLVTIRMDAYLLSRIFVEFVDKRRDRWGKNCREDPKNIIIHVGDAHAQILQRVFNTRTKNTIHQRNKDNNQCIFLQEPFNFFR